MNAEFWKGRSVLMTGHTGFKGSWVTVARATGHEGGGIRAAARGGAKAFERHGVRKRHGFVSET